MLDNVSRRLVMPDDRGVGVFAGQRLKETMFALQVTAMSRVGQQKRDSAMPLLQQHVGCMAAGRAVVDVH